ncbi:hypothetical protein Tco_1069564 [Tanacetum coccineum]|uniref:Uncharacterized protein n=1 Tax=Tanacetum coccineum TaxID=301880 RepID=A0ABQ5HKT4_9ASTR
MIATEETTAAWSPPSLPVIASRRRHWLLLLVAQWRAQHIATGEVKDNANFQLSWGRNAVESKMKGRGLDAEMGLNGGDFGVEITAKKGGFGR